MEGIIDFLKSILIFVMCITTVDAIEEKEGLPLYFWQSPSFVNFGDYLSLKLVERIVSNSVRVVEDPKSNQRKLLAIGSVMPCANENDVIWGSGNKSLDKKSRNYRFKHLDVRAVRGPLTRAFLVNNFDIECPEIFGDPALLLPYFFPEFQKSSDPIYEYLLIVHYNDIKAFPREKNSNIVYATDDWEEIIKKILVSKFVISTSLHGLIVAEAFGVPAKMLRISEGESLFKFEDYYLGTNRTSFQYATTLEEALRMGGEPPFQCDLEKLYDSFPFEFWPNVQFCKPKSLSK